VIALAVSLCGCGDRSEPASKPPPPPVKPVVAPKPEPRPEPPQMVMAVPFWENGATTREVDAASAALHGHLVLDLGEAWTPYLLSDGEDAEGKPLPNLYKATYLALARGEFPDNHHGERARDDKYLELYGIIPTLSLLRTRFLATTKLDCSELDLTALEGFEGLVTYDSNDLAKKQALEFGYLRSVAQQLAKKFGVETPEELTEAMLDEAEGKQKDKERDKDRLRRYLRQAPSWYAVDAAQRRLKCEGYFKNYGTFTRGALDWATHEALAEFERRHMVYSWGYLGKESLAVLRMQPLEAERQAVLRALTERAIHATGVIEDGSTSTLGNGEPRTFRGADGREHPVPNLVSELRERIIEAFGLQTPEKALAWLESLKDLAPDGHHLVAIRGLELPEYYDGDMQLTLQYDRGDVWYDFPYDTTGKELAQPVQRRPRVTIFTRYNDQRIALAQFGTTIGGWRTENVEAALMWKYKNSPVGERAWDRIVAAPVWLPPDGTPPRSLLVRKQKRKANEPEWEVNYHETGPSYASAYGLVAAYHKKFMRGREGKIMVGGDEGIRTHGSVDYMSIMRRHSHGCHRLHNHIAMRLMSFVLAHRPHLRLGAQPLAFKKTIEYEEQPYDIDIHDGGYVFELAEPLIIEVQEGRLRGALTAPIEFPIPKFDETLGAYVTPDGGAVELRGNALVDVPMPVIPDGGVPDGGPVLVPVATPTPVAPSVPASTLKPATVPASTAKPAAAPLAPRPPAAPAPRPIAPPKS
jgi:hypothetical protein